MSLQDAAIAANRFGMGARPGELKTIASDPRGWLKAQLKPETALPAPLAALPSTHVDTMAFTDWYRHLLGANGSARGARTGAGMSGGGMSGGGMSGAGGGIARADMPDGGKAGAGMPSDGMSGGGMSGGGASVAATPYGSEKQKVSVEQSYGMYFSPLYAQATEARFQVAATSDKPLFERVSHFWNNHFSVSGAKPEGGGMAPSYDRDVARAHAMDTFEGMLLASSKHPAMILYLDNYLSVGPNSQLAKNPMVNKRIKGLNENLGREILELHTMGVRSGYTQADVTTLAKIITGWCIKGVNPNFPWTPGQALAAGNDLFNFLAIAHEPGAQTLLGKTYAQAGLDQGEAALHDIAHHPATATFIATKLARHFISDDPPQAAVDRIAKTFRDSGGNLPAVYAAVIDSPEAWDPAPAKMKPPEDFVVSAARALGNPDIPEFKGAGLTNLLRSMGQQVYFASGPNGWADVADNWIGPDPIWKRVEWATTVAQQVAAANMDPTVVAMEALGPTLSPETKLTIQRAESPAQGLALLLVSPEFQKR